ncbi:C40 family peptidase [Streptomyces thermoviolaceus]|uniref:C40 family peptidase n=1 Tax=Streptomyces thermoviolaceus TaxID=1952 RepID=UPI0033B90768
MSGRALRLACAAAVLAQTALTPVTAVAVPQPQPTPSAQPAPPARPAPPAPSTEPSGPGRVSVARLLADLQQLYRLAAQATDAYNAATVQLARQQAEAVRLSADLARTRAALEESRKEAGRLAREQYQGGSGFSPYLTLLLARDPQAALDDGHLIAQVARHRADTVRRLAAAEKRAAWLVRRARASADARNALVRSRQQARDDVRRRLGQVERMLARLSPQQLAELAAWEQEGAAREQDRLTASGALGPDASPTEAGERAVAYALRQLGKPYRWGATGPAAYDCSGLTSQAWAHAGTPIPRTSQEQWARLPRVPLNRLRPGDLIVYFPEASHVALYLGGGKVVQAPRPGTRIKVSPLASNPVLGAVRPDAGTSARRTAGTVSLRQFVPPRLAEAAGLAKDRAGGRTGRKDAVRLHPRLARMAFTRHG